MLHKILLWFTRRVEARLVDFSIGPKDNPYMLRWFVIPRNKWFNIYIHHIRRDDQDLELHDHPWASVSYLLRGALHEAYIPLGYTQQRFRRVDRLGGWTYRPAAMPHRLELASICATTIFITGPVTRKWGFTCPKGWKPWRDYVNQRNSTGFGCGEHDET